MKGRNGERITLFFAQKKRNKPCETADGFAYVLLPVHWGTEQGYDLQR